jgi:hypothetical protein
MKINVIGKKNKEWVIGESDGFETFKLQKKVKRLKDVAENPGYITLKKYLKDENLKITSEDILGKLGFDSIYVLNKEEEIDDGGWWKDQNKKCKTCKKDCKQSHMVEVIKCDEYGKM